MEQDEAMEDLLCETPSLLPTLALSLATSEGPQAPEGPAVVPAPVKAQSGVGSHGKGLKVRGAEDHEDFITFLSFLSVLIFF